MPTQFIPNRTGKKIAVVVERGTEPGLLVFVMHGLGGFKEQPQIEMFAAAFRENGYTTVRFDMRNTIGESEGRMEDATVTSYFEDLEDVIAWSRGEDWYAEPFVLVGHSLGALCSILYAEKYPERVKALAPLSAVVSGTLNRETHTAEELEAWKSTGWRTDESKSKPGVIKRLPWSHMEDRMKYDVLPNAKRLTMPVLLLVGEQDDDTPLRHQQILHDALSGPKELHIIKGARHTFRDPEHLAEIKNIMSDWVKKF